MKEELSNLLERTDFASPEIMQEAYLKIGLVLEQYYFRGVSAEFLQANLPDVSLVSQEAQAISRMLAMLLNDRSIEPMESCKVIWCLSKALNKTSLDGLLRFLNSSTSIKNNDVLYSLAIAFGNFANSKKQFVRRRFISQSPFAVISRFPGIGKDTSDLCKQYVSASKPFVRTGRQIVSLKCGNVPLIGKKVGRGPR